MQTSDFGTGLPGGRRKTDTMRLSAPIRERQHNARVEFSLSDAVYGTIAVAALLAAESARRETYPETIGAVVITLLLYWLAHSYSELLGNRLETPSRLNREAVVQVVAGYISVIKGALLPLIAMLIAWAAGASQETAVTAALWTTVVSLFLLELAAGIRCHARPLVLLFDACVGAAMGVTIFALKAIIH